MKTKIMENTNSHTEARYFAMVKIGWWIFSKWMKIGRHVNGFGLYFDLDYPETYQQAQETLSNYIKYKKPNLVDITEELPKKLNIEPSIMLTDKCKSDFEKWAARHEPFNWNKSTKRLTCMGKHFFEMIEPFQIPAIIQFADEKELFVEIGTRGPIEFDVEVFDKTSETLYVKRKFETRYLAHRAFVKWFNEYYNTVLCKV